MRWQRGIDLIEWTFDPLEIKNAFFNMERLGAIVRRYVLNQYGTTTSHLHGGLADRPLHRGMVDRKPAREGDRQPATRSSAIRWRRASRFRRTSPNFERMTRARAREIQQQRQRTVSRAHSIAGLAVIGFEQIGRGRHVPTGEMGMQIERITLRQIRMPLVHFFETSFGRTTERHIVLVEVIAGGVSGWGEVTAGENPFYNEEWTDSAWLILRDYVAPRVLESQLRKRRGSRRANGAHSRAQHGARRPGSGGLGSGSAHAGTAAVAAHRRRSAARDSVRRFDRHSGFGARSCSRRSKPSWRPATSASR